MEREIAPDARGCGPDAALVEAEFTRLWARWERAIEELGGAIPARELRALLIIVDSGVLPPGRLAVALGISLSGVGRLYDRMAAAGLLRRELSAGTRLEITASAAGKKLAGWIRGRRRAVLAQALGSMSADGRQALIRGLTELVICQGMQRDAALPGTSM